MLGRDNTGRSFGTDKLGFGYLEIYQPLFELYRDKKDAVLAEVGILGGSSLITWRDFLPDCKIIGIDKYDFGGNDRGEHVDSSFFANDDNSEFYLIDQSSRDELNSFAQSLSHGIDIFIDDGSHFQHDMIITFEYIFPKINPGGLYIIEDISTKETLVAGHSWWGKDDEPTIEDCVEETIIRLKDQGILTNKYLDQDKISSLTDSVDHVLFYKAQIPPLTPAGTSSLAIVQKV